MKVGIDIHNCIDLYPDFFRQLSMSLVVSGNEIHVITGQEWDKVKHKVEQAGIVITHHFSIVDFHKESGTKMWLNNKGTWEMDKDIWEKSKGIYAHQNLIDIHFDDSVDYVKWFPKSCTYIVVPKTNFHIFSEWILKGLLAK